MNEEKKDKIKEKPTEITNKIKPSCKNCQTVCSAAKKNFSCKDFVPTHIDACDQCQETDKEETHGLV